MEIRDVIGEMRHQILDCQLAVATFNGTIDLILREFDRRHNQCPCVARESALSTKESTYGTQLSIDEAPVYPPEAKANLGEDSRVGADPKRRASRRRAAS